MKALELPSATFKAPRESINLEYKTSSDKFPKSFWETYSSFANTEGGTIILGISEKPKGVYHVTGVNNPEALATSFWNELHDSHKVSSALIDTNNFLEYKSHGKTLIQIYVPKASNYQRPVYLNGMKQKTFLRTDDGDRLANDEEFKFLIVNSQDHIDSELLDNYTIDDLNLNDVHQYRDLLKKNIQSLDDVKDDDQQFLEDLGVFKIDHSDASRPIKMTAGGLLFFGKLNAINTRFPGFQLDYFKYNSDNDLDWIDRVSSGDMNFSTLNIFSFYNLVISKLAVSIPDKFTQDDDLTRGSYYSDLRSATKEALVNSLMHPYYDSSSPIRIIDRNSFFEFSNPGNMRVTKEAFIRGQDPKSRNSVIPSLFRKVGIAERAGSGGPRIFRSAERNHLHVPDIVTTFDSTLIRIWKVDLLSSFAGTLSADEKDILKFVANQYFVTMPELQNYLPKMTPYRIRKTIKSLLEKDIMIVTGKGNATKYSIKTTEEQDAMEFFRMMRRFEDQSLGKHHQS